MWFTWSNARRQGGNEYINSRCLARQCFLNNSGESLFDDYMPNFQVCSASYKQTVPTPGVPRTYFDGAGNVNYLP